MKSKFFGYFCLGIAAFFLTPKLFAQADSVDVTFFTNLPAIPPLSSFRVNLITGVRITLALLRPMRPPA